MPRRAFVPACLAVVVTALAAPGAASAHCDSLDGPVVAAARRALETGEPVHVLIWVQAADEPEIRAAFDRTLAVRALGPQARDLADRYFFETVVRVHRAGEGAPYTGLKPAGHDVGPAVTAADQAIAARSPAPVAALLDQAIHDGLHAQFERVASTARFEPRDVHAGRAYVSAYVEFVHYVERLYEAAATPAHGHAPEPSHP